MVESDPRQYGSGLTTAGCCHTRPLLSALLSADLRQQPVYVLDSEAADRPAKRVRGEQAAVPQPVDSPEADLEASGCLLPREPGRRGFPARGRLVVLHVYQDTILAC